MMGERKIMMFMMVFCFFAVLVPAIVVMDEVSEDYYFVQGFCIGRDGLYNVTDVFENVSVYDSFSVVNCSDLDLHALAVSYAR